MVEKKNRSSRAGTRNARGGAARGGAPAQEPIDERDPPPPDTTGPANYWVPGGIAVLLVVALSVYVKTRNAVPPEPAAATDADGTAEPAPSHNEPDHAPAAQGAHAGSPEGQQPNAHPPPAAPPPSPTPNAPAQNVAIEPVHPTPSSPDPRGGSFSLAQATEGMPAGTTLVADIQTSMGTFTCSLFADRAPNTVANFVGLARGRREFWDPVGGAWVHRPFYDGSVFHRVIPDFMIQGGDILRSGRGDPGYTIADENVANHDEPGLLCMANRGPNTGGSQFFILEDPKPYLNGSYSVFGRCTPVDLVERIARVPRTPRDQPLTPVFIQHVVVHR